MARDTGCISTGARRLPASTLGRSVDGLSLSLEGPSLARSHDGLRLLWGRDQSRVCISSAAVLTPPLTPPLSLPQTAEPHCPLTNPEAAATREPPPPPLRMPFQATDTAGLQSYAAPPEKLCQFNCLTHFIFPAVSPCWPFQNSTDRTAILSNATGKTLRFTFAASIFLLYQCLAPSHYCYLEDTLIQSELHSFLHFYTAFLKGTAAVSSHETCSLPTVCPHYMTYRQN